MPNIPSGIAARREEAPGLSRRRFLGVASAACASLLSGCGDAGPGVRLRLRFWNGFTGPDGGAMLQIVKAFNASQSEIHVSMQRIEWVIYYNKLLVAALDRRAPDVFVCHASVMTRMAEGGFLSPVDDLLRADGSLRGDDFDPQVLAAVRGRGRTWGVPLDVHPIGMFYNRALFTRAGICDGAGEPMPPVDGDSFVDALRRLRRKYGAAQDNVWGFVFTWMRLGVYSVLRQWGGDIFAADGRTVILDSPENAEALGYLVDLIHSRGLIARPQDGAGFVGFRQGRVGMVFDGIFMLNDLQRQADLDWGAAPLPQLGPQPAAWTDSHMLCMPAEQSAERRAAAAELIRFLSDKSLEWASAGQVPARRSLRASPEFRAMKAQAAFAEQLPHLAYLPRVPFVLEYQSVFDTMIERALRARAAPQVCLREAAAEMREIVERYEARGAAS